ncbi:hypothetical protein [Baaleninema simplex]|uniref:hypothetical protein n=1 Tax=Baaleninema simplex TaxID=2862350 RepID=UPI00130D5411|nr:hypothetical protein [Baaleninema simplex]
MATRNRRRLREPQLNLKILERQQIQSRSPPIAPIDRIEPFPSFNARSGAFNERFWL